MRWKSQSESEKMAYKCLDPDAWICFRIRMNWVFWFPLERSFTELSHIWLSSLKEHTHTYTHNLCLYTHTHIATWTSIHAYTFTHIHKYTFTHICIVLHIWYTCPHTNMYISSTHVHTDIQECMHKLPSPAFPSAAGIHPLRKQFFCEKHGPALRTAPDISRSINTLWWPRGADAHRLPASPNTLSLQPLVSRITLKKKNLPPASVSTWWQQSYKCCGLEGQSRLPQETSTEAINPVWS